MQKLTLGCDPEFFLYDTVTNRYVSAHDKVPGNKKSPHPLKHGAVQADGTAVEFNIDPASTAEEFSHNIQEVLAQIRKMVPIKYRFCYQPIVQYDPIAWKEIPDTAKELGCDPDFNYQTLQHNVIPTHIGRNRTASGHIHFGWSSKEDTTPNSPHFLDCAILTKQFIQSIGFLECYWEMNKWDRLTYYGNNAFRPKPYGVEVRYLGASWLNYPKLWPWLFDSSKVLFENTLEGQLTLSYNIPMFDSRIMLS